MMGFFNVKMLFLIRPKLQYLAICSLLFGVSLTSNAHMLGYAWKDMGNNTVRFYAEIAHDGITEAQGGQLQVGPWGTAQLHAWAGVINDVTFEELGIDDMAYWDPYDERSTIIEEHYATHAVAPGTYGNFFYVDVPDFVSGNYLLSAISANAYDRPISWSYLDVYIHVPEPPVLALFGGGLLLLLIQKYNGRRKSHLKG